MRVIGKIVCSAIKFYKKNEFSFILTGKRHSDCFKSLQDIKGDKYALCNEIQGFIDEGGNFRNRKIAYIIAVRNGQIKEKEDKRLFSEDLFK